MLLNNYRSQKHEADNFAHRIAHYLEEAYNANKFEQLLIIADPLFLACYETSYRNRLKNCLL